MQTSSQVPDKLGRFQIVRRLGTGAQSVVYLAFDPQLHREVALKALRGSADTAASLLNEARAVSRLSHAAIIPVFEAAKAEPGLGGAAEGESGAYLVFEYVAGPTLTEVLSQKGAMQAVDAVKLLLPVLDAVAYAHAHGVIHRDLKPSNILLDRRGMARVMDFGIAVHQVSGIGGIGSSAYADSVVPDAPSISPGNVIDTSVDLHALVGTPAYMAPEYAQHGKVSPQMDVFSAGLILYEMLAGRRAVPGDVGFQAIHFLVNSDISLPTALRYPVDARLRGILGRALARDPALRYTRMADFAAALQAWATPSALLGDVLDNAQALGSTVATAVVSGARAGAVVNATAQAVALEGLLRRIRLKSEFPAVAASLVIINRLVVSDRQNLAALSDAVLRDVALTQKLLRMVNSSMYRGFGGGEVTTVSRAIQLLGTGAVRTAATSLPLLDPNVDKAHAARLLDDMALAHFCGTVARELSGMWEIEAEEAFVCGCFHRLGRMLLTCYFPDEAAEITRRSRGHAENQRAVRQVLGLDCEALGMGVAKHWGMPDIVVRSMRAVVDPALLADPLLAGELHPVATPITHPEVLRHLSSLANELTRAWMMDITEQRNTATTLAIHCYAKALNVTSLEVKAAINSAVNVTKRLLQAWQQDLRYSEVAQRLGLVTTRPGEFVEQAAASEVPLPPNLIALPDDEAILAGLAQAHCQELLAASVQTLSGRLLEPFKLNALVLEVLTALQHAASFRQVIFCVREAKTYALVGRIAVGAAASGDKDPGRLHVAMDNPSDPFAAAVFKGEDLWLPNLSEHAIGHRKVMDAQSVLLLPLQLKGQPLGLIYADYGPGQTVHLTPKALALMGTLRNQVVLAFRQR